MKFESRLAAVILSVGLVVPAVGAVGCGNTVRGATQDTARAADNVAGAANTVDVKAALIADDRVDTSNLNVDTDAKTNTVVLKGTVPTNEQKQIAEQVARERAKGYRIVNQLTVRPAA